MRTKVLNALIPIMIVAILSTPIQNTIPDCSSVVTNEVYVAPDVLGQVQSCASCESGYYSYVSSTMPTIMDPVDIFGCSACDGNCVECLGGPTNCIECSSGFYVDSAQECVDCMDIFDACEQCNEAACKFCRNLFVPGADGKCIPDCPAIHGASCLTCSFDDCQTYASGFALNTATVPAVCEDCSSIPQCVECTSSTNGPICSACNGDNYLNFATMNRHCVSCSILNCVICQDGPECIRCTTGFIVTVGGNWNSCGQCPSGSYFQLNQCSPCPDANCDKCSDVQGDGIVQCTLCFTPYFLDNNVCTIDCQSQHTTDCVTCDAAKCLTCTGSLVVDHLNNCVPCSNIAKCLSCGNGPICSDCQPGYYLDLTSPTKACVACSTIPDCVACVHGPQCTKCADNFVVDTDALWNMCLPCPVGGYVSSPMVCSSCPNGCASCSLVNGVVQCQTCINPYSLNNNQCTINCPAEYGTGCLTCNNMNCLGCSAGYAFTVTSPTICTACSTLPNCVSCRNGLVCEACSAGFVTDTLASDGSCVPCSLTDCILCKNGPQCINCAINYVLNGNGRLNGCTTCPPGQYASSTSKCTLCPTECSTCSYSANGITCPSCNPIAIHNSTSQQCIHCKFYMNHCIQCSGSSICTACQYPYKLGPRLICDQCQQDFVYLDGFCRKEKGCLNYLSAESKCLACVVTKNFYFDNTNKKCTCKNGYYASKTPGLEQCVSKCGDGILVPPQEVCDDGNVINGDGCSDSCQQENDFVCLPVQPSQCLLQFTPVKLQYNYAYKYEGENKGRFSLLIEPYHPALKKVNWAKYLFVNVSQDFIVNGSKVFAYIEQTNQLTIEFEYKRTVEDIIVEFRLVLDQAIELNNYRPRLLLSNTQNETITTKRLLASSSQMKFTIQLNGVNSKLVYEDQAILQVYKAASIGSYIVTILIMVQFVFGSYTHKMIGLQTIHILQFFFFVRIILEQRLSTFLNAINVFKYATNGGYSNYQFIYGSETQQTQTITYMTVDGSFLVVDLMKYFTLNTNIALVIPALSLIGFMIAMGRKSAKRREYLRGFDQSTKDEYTILRRSCLWVYDHFVFPYINIFNMIAVFSTVLYLQANSPASKSSSSSLIKLIETTSFATHLTVAFATFFIYSFQIFQSYQEFKHSQLTEDQKARIPKSIYEKLQHDENNPDRPNYKPGYILFYMVFYLFVELVLMIDVLFVQLENLGVEIMLVLTFCYLLFVWKWQPYSEAVDFHNKALRFNHFTVVFFMAFGTLSKRIELPSITYAIITCLILAMLTVVGVIGYIRIALELKFRKKLLDDPTLMNARNPMQQIQTDQPLSKKEALLKNNPFSFENQVRAWLKQNKNMNVSILCPQQIEKVKGEIRKEIYEQKRLQRINDSKGIMFNGLHAEKDKIPGQQKSKRFQQVKQDTLNENRQIKL